MTEWRLFSPLSLTLAAAGLAVTALGFATIPADRLLPVHWGLDGNPDAMMPRTFALLTPVFVVALMWAILFAVERWAPEGRKAGGRHAVRVVIAALTGLFVAIQTAVVAIGMDIAVDVVRIVAVGVALLLIVLGNVMPKSQPNSFAGLRIPSTLNDAANWQATHRLTGWLLVASGLALLLAGLVVPVGIWLFACVMLAIVVPLVIGTVYSLRFARRGRTA